MSRRSLLLLPTLAAALAVPAGPALANEEDESPSATLRATQGRVAGDRARVAVTGDLIDSVGFYVDGRHLRTVVAPDADGRFRVTMDCRELSPGAHRARAVVWFAEGSSAARRTLRFQITRVRQGAPRFTG